MLQRSLRFSIFLIGFIGGHVAFGQAHQTLASGPTSPDEKPGVHLVHDTCVHNFRDFISQGRVEGHVRNYFMATVNHDELHDYWTNATGGALKYSTPYWKGLQVGVKGIFSYQTLSSDLLDVDSLVGKSAKWEKELYDILQPGVTHHLDRLEELYIRLALGRSYIEYGKLDINTGPYLLRRDGRMKPFVFKGLWFDWGEWKNHRFRGGFINAVSPRGMVEWFSLTEAIGLLNNGYTTTGKKADYHEQVEIRAMWVLGYEAQLNEHLKVQYWGTALDRVYQSHWLQADWTSPHWELGAQLVHQRSLPAQSELAPENQYMHPTEKPWVLCTELGFPLVQDDVRLSMAYLEVFGEGRFLFPRELGRENFYVSQPRSWIDGLGQSRVFQGRFEWKPQKALWSVDWRLSRVHTPGLDEFEHNKFNLPSYYQSTFDVRYHFSRWLQGLHLHFLYVARWSENQLDIPLEEQFYRTNFHHFNLIANLKF